MLYFILLLQDGFVGAWFFIKSGSHFFNFPLVIAVENSNVSVTIVMIVIDFIVFICLTLLELGFIV